ncbi:hypothetical protein [Xanthomonas campestris]|uniref:hypothetical protein n=1 Tax=Xanthomonas campestris TaxID=339 RepID=UPI00388DE4E8
MKAALWSCFDPSAIAGRCIARDGWQGTLRCSPAIRPLRALLLRDYGERLSPMQDTQTAGENRQTTSEVNGKARAGVRITLQVAQAKAINFNM